MRSAPTSAGLSTRRRTPVLIPGATTNVGWSRYRSPSRVNACVSGGTTLPTASASRSASARSSCASSPSMATASSSSVRSWTLARRHVRRSAALSYTPRTTLVLPTSTASSVVIGAAQALIVRFGRAGAQASLPVGAERLRDVRRDVPLDGGAERDQLLHARRGEEQVFGRGHEVDHLDPGRELAIHV